MNLETIQSDKEWRKIANAKGKVRLNGKWDFFVAVFIEFYWKYMHDVCIIYLYQYNTYIKTYIQVHKWCIYAYIKHTKIYITCIHEYADFASKNVCRLRTSVSTFSREKQNIMIRIFYFLHTNLKIASPSKRHTCVCFYVHFINKYACLFGLLQTLC